MNISRRSWLSFAVLIAALVAAYAQKPAPNQAVAEPIRITTGPYLQNPSESAMTIMWITSRNATGAVEYGPPNGELKTVFNSHDGLIDTNERIHKVVLTGLSPGTVYRYRVVSREILKFAAYKVDFGETINGGFHEFRTPDRRESGFSFLVFNDIHDIPATLPDLLKVAGERPYDFVVLNGDTVDAINHEGQITAILNEAVSSFASRVPLIWARGNHETRGELARDLPRYLASPNGRFFYSFDQGPVHFVVLDTGEDKTDSSPEYSGLVDFYPYRREEAEWLKAEVKSEAFRRARYRVVFAHMPFPAASRPASGTRSQPAAGGSAQGSPPSPFTGMADAYENFGATLEQAGIDLMISGHVHSPAIIEAEPGRHSYPIVRGGGPKAQGRTVIRVEVTERALEAVVLRPDGTTFGACRVAAKR